MTFFHTPCVASVALTDIRLLWGIFTRPAVAGMVERGLTSLDAGFHRFRHLFTHKPCPIALPSSPSLHSSHGLHSLRVFSRAMVATMLRCGWCAIPIGSASCAGNEWLHV